MNVDIEKIKRRLLIKYPSFGSVIANTNFIEEKRMYSNKIPTLGTDGSNIYYHPDAINSVTEEEKLFLFAHEICHIAFNHILRREGKDKKLWNIATDAVINALLNKDGLPLTKYSINMPEAVNYDAEELYNKLLNEKNKYLIEPNSNDKKSLEDFDYDNHNIWEKETCEKTKEDDTLEEKVKKISQKNLTDLGEK